MAKKTRPPARPFHTSHTSPRKDGDGNHIQNEILLDLPRTECDGLLAKLEFVRLKTHHVLHEPGDTLKSAYFCNSGLVSILNVFSDGKSVEVGLVGKEGFIGLPLVAGFRTAPNRAMAQVDATAFRIDGEVLRIFLRQCPNWNSSCSSFPR
jgi:CRP-like cAMP-binding protein